MKSSSNTYLANLDHLRAFAAFMVFIWHFVHFSPNCQLECDQSFGVRIPFISVLEQGYTGVALFMCISGYIFTYLAYGKRLHIGTFWYNRLLRLLPLVIFWGIAEGFNYINAIIEKGMSPESILTIATLLLHPQGSWTIYIELEYYLALPLILYCIGRFGARILLWVLLALVTGRALWWFHAGSIEQLSYWTIVGHADQFVLGTTAFHLEQWIKRTCPRPKRVLGMLGIMGIAMVAALYQYLESLGGYSRQGPVAASMLWVFLPTIEGLGYCLMIISYLQFSIPDFLSRPLSAMGRWSYSIYLDHFQMVPFLYIFAITRFHMGATFFARLGIATFFIFPLVVFFSAGTYALIEKPFLRLRRSYLSPSPANPPAPAAYAVQQ